MNHSRPSIVLKPKNLEPSITPTPRSADRVNKWSQQKWVDHICVDINPARETARSDGACCRTETELVQPDYHVFLGQIVSKKDVAIANKTACCIIHEPIADEVETDSANNEVKDVVNENISRWSLLNLTNFQHGHTQLQLEDCHRRRYHEHNLNWVLEVVYNWIWLFLCVKLRFESCNPSFFCLFGCFLGCYLSGS